MIFNMTNSVEYTYKCNSVNDNVNISNIVKEFLSGGTNNGSMKLNVTGKIGCQGVTRGSGSTTDPYGVFDFNVESNRRVILDFTNCTEINPTIESGKCTIVFYTLYNVSIIGANVIASNTTTGTIVRVFNASSGVIYAENCRFWLNGYLNSLIALNGTFFNCRGSVANITENTYCFLPSDTALIRVYGGEYYAYTGDSTKQSAVVGQSSANSVSVLYGVNAPTLARGGFYQTNSILQWAGGGVLSCTDLVSALPMIVVSGISNIRGTITKNKAGMM